MFIALCLSMLFASASPAPYDVIVVGAGPAGLNAARILKEKNLNVLVLEAQDRVGGRVYSQPIGDGQFIELGAQWMAKVGHTRLENLVNQYGFQAHTHRAEDKLDLSIPAQLDTLQVFLRLKWILHHVNVAEPWKAAKYDQILAQDWIENSSLLQETRRFWMDVIEQEMCCDPTKVSMLEVAQVMKTVGKVERLETADHYFFPQGLGNLFKKMSQDLGPSLKLNERVIDVSQIDSLTEIKTTKETYQAKHVILAIPPQLLKNLNLPPALSRASEGFYEAQVVKMIAVYDSPWWRAKGIDGKALAKGGLLDTVLDSSASVSDKGVLVGFIAGPRSAEVAKLTLQEKENLFRRYIQEKFGESPQPIKFFSHDWTSDEFARGGYASRRMAGEWTRSGELMSRPFGRILFAGTENAREWRGFIEGALESGERAAVECERLLATRTEI